jgi:hypothetical protein
MPTFTPPTQDRTPAVLPETRGLQLALYRHVRPIAQGLNIWKMPDGTYLLDQQPQQLSNPDPARHDDDATTPVITYYGGHVYTVSTAEAAALTAAGYGAYLT